MSRAQQDHRPALQAFYRWVESARCQSAVGGISDPTRSFIPLSSVQSFFDNRRNLVGRILEEIFPDSDPPVSPEGIARRYPRAFCILLLISKGCYIENFVSHESLSDQHLPFENSAPKSFPITSDPRFFDMFYEQQWCFCAPSFEDMMQKVFEPNVILPIIRKEELAGGGSAITHKIEIHHAYNEMTIGNKV